MSCDEIWVTANGDHIKVCDMTEQHAKNALNMLLRRHREAKVQFQQESAKQFFAAAGGEEGGLGAYMHEQDILGTKGASQ